MPFVRLVSIVGAGVEVVKIDADIVDDLDAFLVVFFFVLPLVRTLIFGSLILLFVLVVIDVAAVCGHHV